MSEETSGKKIGEIIMSVPRIKAEFVRLGRKKSEGFETAMEMTYNKVCPDLFYEWLCRWFPEPVILKIIKQGRRVYYSPVEKRNGTYYYNGNVVTDDMVRKGYSRFHTCPDCGIKFIGHRLMTRCMDCQKANKDKYNKKYTRHICPEIICVQCSVKFTSSRKNRKYCTDACRQKAYRSRRDE